MDNEIIGGGSRVDELNKYFKKINKDLITEDDEPFLNETESSFKNILTEELKNIDKDLISNILSLDDNEDEKEDDEYSIK